MKNLLYKEFKLAIHPFFLIMPFLTGALILIPQWPYFIALMYFIFIAAPNIFATYNSQNDMVFSAFMPVKKTDIVKSKIAAIVILELLHITAALFYALLHNVLFGINNFLLDLNMAFFGLVFVMFGLFNVLFFPMYFKTAYKYGLPLIISSVAVVLFMMLVELPVSLNKNVAVYLESPQMSGFQFSMLVSGIIVFIILTLSAYKLSAKRFESVEL